MLDLVELREGDALTTLAADLPESIDLVLLDGAKSPLAAAARLLRLGQVGRPDHRPRHAQRPEQFRNLVPIRRGLHRQLDQPRPLAPLGREQRVIDRNPCDMASLPQVRPDATIRFLTVAELERVLDAPPGADTTQAERDWLPGGSNSLP